MYKLKIPGLEFLIKCHDQISKASNYETTRGHVL